MPVVLDAVAVLDLSRRNEGQPGSRGVNPLDVDTHWRILPRDRRPWPRFRSFPPIVQERAGDGRVPEPLADLLSSLAVQPHQALKLDERLVAAARPIDDETRARMWRTLDRVLSHRPEPPAPGNAVGLLLGRIQSGKTTAMTGLAALAHDRGYRIVVAILGSTNLLLAQNTTRLLAGLGLAQGLTSDYVWAHLDPTVERRRLGRELDHYLATERTVLITVLKNSRRLQTVAEHLERLDLREVPALILDDEADQASLNTLVSEGLESPTYRSISTLTGALPSHLYVQVTATPFAPLLLQPGDLLSPTFVEVLEPGPGYTGAREFFVDNSDAVVRLVSPGEALTRPPPALPIGLRQALANYLLGAAILLAVDPSTAPVSMLLHPTHRVAIHERVALLLYRELSSINAALEMATSVRDLAEPFPTQYDDLLRWGAVEVEAGELLDALRRVARLVRVSVVNSAADQDSVVWASSPAHILVGGNKLDRGFTVEGLTVSYLSRSTSTQADTLAQRARAFGYRREYLPYCRFFANSSTVEAFQASVLTEEAMRSELQQWLSSGRALSSWSEHVGFVLGQGLTPTRNPVAPWLSRIPSRGWHVLASPDMSNEVQAENRAHLEELGLLRARRKSYGRLDFRTLENVPISRVAALLSHWSMPARSGWSRSDIITFVQRVAKLQSDLLVDVVLLDGVGDGAPRIRSWRPIFGFSNLMQGRDNGYTGRDDQYPGDRAMFGARSGLQVHWLRPRGDEAAPPVFTLALHVGEDITAATEVRRA